MNNTYDLVTEEGELVLMLHRKEVARTEISEIKSRTEQANEAFKDLCIWCVRYDISADNGLALMGYLKIFLQHR